MVLLLMELPDGLQQLFAELMSDAATVGRLAQASQACKELLQPRLEALKQAQRLAAAEAAQARGNQKREAIMACFEPLEEGAIVYRCIIHQGAMGTTPCRQTLKVTHNKLGYMLNHIKRFHPAQYGVMSVLFN
jgi:hypothetical protein